jgi:hypothetical protein
MTAEAGGSNVDRMQQLSLAKIPSGPDESLIS